LSFERERKCGRGKGTSGGGSRRKEKKGGVSRDGVKGGKGLGSQL